MLSAYNILLSDDDIVLSAYIMVLSADIILFSAVTFCYQLKAWFIS
jgi:hypothetical protein